MNTASNTASRRARSSAALRRRGMILLVVLGMLGLFSLLSVTYLVFSGQSRTTSLILNRAKLQSVGKVDMSVDIIPMILRGTKDNSSAFFGHSLLGDVYGRHAIEGSIRDYRGGFAGFTLDNTMIQNSGNTWDGMPNGAVLLYNGKDNAGNTIPVMSNGQLRSDATILKVPLGDQNITTYNSVLTALSPQDDAYNGRLFTMMEGPLKNVSFRILKYVGFEAMDEATSHMPPVDALAFSIAIDISEVPSGLRLAGPVRAAGKQQEYSGTIESYVDAGWVNALFYKPDGEPYRFLINDAVYNGIGYGANPLKGDLSQNWYQHVDPQNFPNPADDPRNFLPQLPGGQILPVGLLPSMVYIKDHLLQGSTNEGYDVADYRDFWLSSVNPDGDSMLLPSGQVRPVHAAQIIPSFHRPELVNYIWRLYDGPDNSSPQLLSRSGQQIKQMLEFVVLATARPVSVTFNGAAVTNFKSSNRSFATPDRPTANLQWSSPPKPAEAEAVRNFLATLVRGPWDVDNDGDGIAESVWIDPGLPNITSPDGRQLRALAAVHIVDLDNRINVNLAADTNHGYVTTSGSYAERVHQDYSRAGEMLDRQSQSSPLADFARKPFAAEGLGNGPLDLGLAHLFQDGDLTNRPYNDRLQDQINFVRGILAARHGDDVPANVNDAYQATGLPGVAFGRSGTGPSFLVNDPASRPFENNRLHRYPVFDFVPGPNTLVPQVAALGRMPQLNVGRAVMSLDRGGNYSFQRPPLRESNGTTVYDRGAANPRLFAADSAINVYDEIVNDAAEQSQTSTRQDRPFTLEELERVLRRFDSDVATLPDRLHKSISQTTNGAPDRYSTMSAINRVITTRSQELRNPPIGFPGLEQAYDVNDDENDPQHVGDLMSWIALLLEHRHRNVRKPNDDKTSDLNDPSAIQRRDETAAAAPRLHPKILRALFPIEFRYGLRMDLNRPLGNNQDYVDPYLAPNGTTLPEVTNNTVDEPAELARLASNGHTDSAGFHEIAPVEWNEAGAVTAKVHGHYDNVDYFSTAAFGAIRRYPYDGTVTQPSKFETWETTTPVLPGNNSRQLFARQLYCLAQLLVPMDYRLPGMPDPTKSGMTLPPPVPPLARTYPDYKDEWYLRRARVLAQWAINVADFRDADAICTRFEYDVWPFGIGDRDGGADPMIAKEPGWTPQAGCVVWGMEYPELLMTESLALHDKRVRMTKLYPDAQKDGDEKQPKPTQYRIPEASLFVELFNPRAFDETDDSFGAAVPHELYTKTISNGVNVPALDLAKMAPADSLGIYGRQPVWRIGITAPVGQDGAPADAKLTPEGILNPVAGANPPGPGGVQPPPAPSDDGINTTNQTGDPTKAKFSGLFSDLTEFDRDILKTGATPLADPAAQLEFERVIEFVTEDRVNLQKVVPNFAGGDAKGNLTTNIRKRIFYNTIETPTVAADAKNPTKATEPTLLPAGGYLVIAPRWETRVGSTVDPKDPNLDTRDPQYSPSDQRIIAAELDDKRPRVSVYDLEDKLQNHPFFDLTRGEMRVMIMQSESPDPATWNSTNSSDLTRPLPPNEGIGLNVSAPMANAYYPIPKSRLNNAGGYENRRPDSYSDQPLNTNGNFDTLMYPRAFDDDPKINPILCRPIKIRSARQHKTHLNFRTMYLQRLANPLAAYDPVENPYLTIDFMPIDLTLFTGEQGPQEYSYQSPTATDEPGEFTQVTTEKDPKDTTKNLYGFEPRFKDGRGMNASRLVNDNQTLGEVMDPKLPNQRINLASAELAGSYMSASTAQVFRTKDTMTGNPKQAFFPYELGMLEPDDLDYRFSSATLGYLNVGHQAKDNLTAFSNAHPTPKSFDGFGPPVDYRTIPANVQPSTAYYGTPDPTFRTMAGLFWPNRNFVSGNELTLVPWTGPGKLSSHYSTAASLGGLLPAAEFSGLGPRLRHRHGRDEPLHPHPGVQPDPFGHLWNFQSSSVLQTEPYHVTNNPSNNPNPVGMPQYADPYQPVGKRTNPPVPRREEFWLRRDATSPNFVGPDLSLLLELVEVPPQYPESYKTLHPYTVDPGATNDNYYDPVTEWADQSRRSGDQQGHQVLDQIRRRFLSDFHSPHNHRPTYTAPGKINVNTIDDGRVWHSIEWALGDDIAARLSPFGDRTDWEDRIVQMRRGYRETNGTEFEPATNLEAAPRPLFLDFVNSDHQSNIDNRYPSQFVGAFRSPFNANVTTTVAAGSKSGFQPEAAATTTLRRNFDATYPIKPTTKGDPNDDLLLPSVNTPGEVAASPHHAFDRMNRLANLTTRQSNNFAIWITVGFFEWDAITGLGQEYVGPDGQSNRQRSFYLIDRTVPVAFREGESFNTEAAILLRRKIER